MLAAVPPSTIPVIPSYVADRIGFYQKALYSPSEQLDYSITTIAGQSIYAFENYPLLSGVQWIEGVRYLLGNIWIPLSRADWYSDILQADVLSPPFITQPAYWATYGQTIRFYPTPSAAWSIELQCNLSPPAPVNDADQNFWTQKSATLIIEATCAEICATYLNDQDRATVHASATKREEDSLKNWTMRLRGPSQVRPWI